MSSEITPKSDFFRDHQLQNIPKNSGWSEELEYEKIIQTEMGKIVLIPSVDIAIKILRPECRIFDYNTRENRNNSLLSVLEISRLEKYSDIILGVAPYEINEFTKKIKIQTPLPKPILQDLNSSPYEHSLIMHLLDETEEQVLNTIYYLDQETSAVPATEWNSIPIQFVTRSDAFATYGRQLTKYIAETHRLQIEQNYPNQQNRKNGDQL